MARPRLCDTITSTVSLENLHYSLITYSCLSTNITVYWEHAIMSLSYETQIELIFPAAVFETPDCASVMDLAGIQPNSRGNKIMLFTSPPTVSALNAEPESVLELFRASKIGLVLYGWNQHGRDEFLIATIRKLAASLKGDDLRKSVFRLSMFCEQGFLGKLNPNPFAGPLPPATEKFDLKAAIDIMLSADELQGPKSPDHQRAARAFGQRRSL